MDSSANQLPSSVAETLSACPRFRILVVGKSGVGKSSLALVISIHNQDIDIADGRAGSADIRHEYTSPKNERLILHDSQGFEPGSEDNWELVEDFLRERSAMETQDQVHAVWLCIQSPREGDRVQQAGDEKLLMLARQLNISVIAVFTKFDRLLKEQQYQHRNRGTVEPAEIERQAEYQFDERIKGFKQSTGALIVKVSTDLKYRRRLETLNNLTTITIRSLGGVEESLPSDVGEWASDEPPEAAEGNVLPTLSNAHEGRQLVFVAAQQTNAVQKIEFSVREGFKKYWRNLGQSIFFQGQTLKNCVWRIHDDILRVWNLNDPEKILRNEPFVNMILKLVEPILQGHEGEIDDETDKSKSNDIVSNGVGTLTNLATSNPSAAPILIGIGVGLGLGILTVKFLFGAYKKTNLSAQYLVAYIVHLTCILHCIFTASLEGSTRRELSEEFITSVVERYKKRDVFSIDQSIRGMSFYDGLEKKIRRLIYDSLSMTPNGSAMQPEVAADKSDEQEVYETSRAVHSAPGHHQGGTTSPRAKRKKARGAKDSQCIVA
ncbi:hypothetical protein CVT26_012853 [Gymnopilus dilepis]|uniref:G domain-containing protein n=1 Tax=Gymnopilus dilepis TaxID=231916 RepID=A0A409WDN4_9AGAR|nr:hypothetical protein CVT26_012853 [Gymnopilus dilepis]